MIFSSIKFSVYTIIFYGTIKRPVKSNTILIADIKRGTFYNIFRTVINLIVLNATQCIVLWAFQLYCTKQFEIMWKRNAAKDHRWKVRKGRGGIKPDISPTLRPYLQEHSIKRDKTIQKIIRVAITRIFIRLLYVSFIYVSFIVKLTVSNLQCVSISKILIITV